MKWKELKANSHEVEEERLIEVEEEEKLGPMIICVDTSGSMQGSPETIAKVSHLIYGHSCSIAKAKLPFN